jgi:hypothetical protein
MHTLKFKMRSQSFFSLTSLDKVCRVVYFSVAKHKHTIIDTDLSTFDLVSVLYAAPSGRGATF